MAIDKSELSSLSYLLSQISERLVQMAEDALKSKDEANANELYSIERHLSNAGHKIERLLAE
ncbi:MAG: hypothetical protein M1374_06640 [Firmicutes bacterium]|nr:hypothetical protein [Bacillota bacterium]